MLYTISRLSKTNIIGIGFSQDEDAEYEYMNEMENDDAE